MKTMHDILIIRTTVLALLLVYAGSADAYGSLRCKGRIVDVGDSAAEVLSLCGEPSKRTSTTLPVRSAVRSGFTRFVGYSKAEQWTYDRGYGKFPAVLHFDNGVLRRIEHLSKRSGKR